MRNGSTLLGDFDWESSRHGSLGWTTHAHGSADGQYVVFGADVAPLAIKHVDDEECRMLVLPGRGFDDVIGLGDHVFTLGVPNGTEGSYHGAFGGTSNQIVWMTYGDSVYVTTDVHAAEPQFTKTAITGMPVHSNGGLGRVFGKKGAPDPVNDKVYYIFMGQAGLHYTLDQGATKVSPGWCPAPSHPIADTTGRYGLISIDPASAMTAAGATSRRSRIAFAPSGQGIWLSTDGGASGTKISNTVHYVSAAPSDSVGANGDYYVNTTTHKIFGPKASGAWPGGAGADVAPGGATVFYGTDPIYAVSGGANGNYYLRQGTEQLFGPKASGTWPGVLDFSLPAGITGPSIIDAVSAMEWVGSKLYVAAINKFTSNPELVRNLHCYDASAGTWSKVDTATQANIPVQCLTKDPRFTNGLFCWLQNNEFLHTQDGSTFVEWFGNNYGPTGNKASGVCRTKPRFRPRVAAKFRYQGAGFAVSDPCVVGDYIYMPTGLGPLRTLLADFPLTGALGDNADPNTSTKWPLWEEDCANFELVVAQMALFVEGDDEVTLWCGGQDIAIPLWEDGRRGHRATVYSFPSDGSLSDIHCMAQGSAPSWAVGRRTRATGNVVPGFCYTTDNQKWHNMPNQPAQGDAAVYESGGCAAGPLGEALCFPGRYGGNPMGTRDFGATAWVSLRFWIGGTELDMSDWITNEMANGFQGSNFSNMHHLVWHDNAHPGNYYCVNIGASNTPADTGDWVTDPLGWAGIYHMAPGDWPNFRRVYAGHPNHTANFALYDAKLIGDGNGDLFFKTNYLPQDAKSQHVHLARFNMTTWQKTLLTNLTNVVSFAFGAPFPGDSQKCLWALGWKPLSQSDADNPAIPPDRGDFGLWYCRDHDQATPTFVGPFSVDTENLGFMSYIDAHPTEFGVIAGALHTRGHALGRYKMRAN
jgi:hypothetical protein